MSHRFWVNTDSTKYVFGQQLLLPAVITSIHGDVITTDAMVIYDTRSGNINFIHFGNYCILALNFGESCSSSVMIANTGPSIQNVDCQYDWIYRIYNPTMSVGQKFLQSASEQDITGGVGGAGSRNDNVINAADRAMAPGGSATQNICLRSTFGHRYYLSDYFYRIGDPNFRFYLTTVLVEAGTAYTSGLLFFQQYNSRCFIMIFTIFETAQLHAYSMAGCFYPGVNTYDGHCFAIIGDGGVSIAYVY